MTPNQQITTVVLILSALLLIAWDIVVFFRRKELKATISWLILDWSRRVPLLPFAFGVLMGHFFWPQN